MEQTNKMIIVGNEGASQVHTYEDFLYKCAYGMFPQERSEYLDPCLGLIKSQQLVRLGVLKFFYLIQAIGFFGSTKVNLRNAP